MANICTNQYKFIFGDEEKAKKFFDFIGDGSSDCSGNSVYNLGIAAKIENAEHRDIREWIDDKDISDSSVRVNTQSKWTPCPKAWRDIARTFDESVEVFYEAEEPGCEIFDSNDPEFVGKYVFDFWGGDDELVICCEDSEIDSGVYSESEMVEILQKILGSMSTDLDLLVEMADKRGLSDCLSVHRIEYRSIDDWAE